MSSIDQPEEKSLVTKSKDLVDNKEKYVHEFYTHLDFMDYVVKFGSLKGKTIRTLKKYPILYFIVRYDYAENMKFGTVLQQFEHNSNVKKMSKTHWYHLNVKCNPHMQNFLEGTTEEEFFYCIIDKFLKELCTSEISSIILKREVFYQPIPDITIEDIEKSLITDISCSLNFKLDHLLYSHFMSDVLLKNNIFSFTYKNKRYAIDYNLIELH